MRNRNALKIRTIGADWLIRNAFKLRTTADWLIRNALNIRTITADWLNRNALKGQ